MFLSSIQKSRRKTCLLGKILRHHGEATCLVEQIQYHLLRDTATLAATAVGAASVPARSHAARAAPRAAVAAESLLFSVGRAAVTTAPRATVVAPGAAAARRSSPSAEAAILAAAVVEAGVRLAVAFVLAFAREEVEG